MAMVVKNNMSAVNTLNILNKNSAALSKSLKKVSSGMKINGAADDASGYAISERMRVQIRSLDQANSNTQNGSSLMKVAEGAVSSTVDILKTLKEKVINAANDTNTDSDRQTIQKELDQSIDQINDNAAQTFNGKYLVDGSHNTQVQTTTTAMTNQSLDKTTTGNTAFTAMKDRNGNSLNIHNLDTVEISFVKEGKTYTTSMQLQSNGKNQDLEGLLSQANIEYQKQNGSYDAVATLASDGKSYEYDAAKVKNMLENKGYKYVTELTNVKVGTDGMVSSANNAWVNQKTGGIIASDEIDSDGNIAVASSTATETYFTGDANMQAVLGNAGFDPTKGSAGITADAMKTALANNGYTLNADGKNWGNGVASIATGVVSADGTIAAGKVGSATTTSTATHYAVEDQDAVALGLDQDAAKSTAGVVPTDAKTAFATDIGTSGYIGRDVAGDTVNTADEGNALTIKAADKGVDNQISGVTITVKNTKGQEQKAVNASLDNFSESIRAQNQSNDNAITLQTGTKANQSIRVGLTDMRAQALGLQATDGKTLQIGTYSQANAAINVLDNAVQKALDQQTTIGSIESRLEYTSSNLTTASENVQASESTIRDADMAKEMTEYTKNNVLLQAAQSMLAQANQNSSAVLSLLK